MVSTRNLAQLLGHADRAGSKVVMIGDDRQLAAIDTGGAFRAFRLRLGASELRGNHRQRTQLGQDAPPCSATTARRRRWTAGGRRAR